MEDTAPRFFHKASLTALLVLFRPPDPCANYGMVCQIYRNLSKETILFFSL